MTWPGWNDVLPLLTTLVTTLAALIAAVVTWARISDRTVSRAVEKAGRQSEKAAAAAVDRLYERLKNNDFSHVEERIESTVARIDRGLADARADREAMEVRIGERFDRMGGRIERMEARILAAVQRRPDTDEPEAKI